MELRPYQQEARDAILHEWDTGRQRTLMVLPTGTGKTIVFCSVSEEVVRRGGRVLSWPIAANYWSRPPTKCKRLLAWRVH